MKDDIRVACDNVNKIQEETPDQENVNTPVVKEGNSVCLLCGFSEGL